MGQLIHCCTNGAFILVVFEIFLKFFMWIYSLERLLSQICNMTRALLSEANDKWRFEAPPHMCK